MAESLQVLSWHEIVRPELEAIIVRQGGSLRDRLVEYAVGTIQEDDGAIWISLPEISLESWALNDVEGFLTMFEGQPRTVISIDRTHNDLARAITVRFLEAVFDRWPKSVIERDGFLVRSSEISVDTV